MDKEDVVSIDIMEYYSAIKNEIMPFAATSMHLEIIILNEVRQKERDKYHIITYMWKLKYDTNETKRTNLWLPRGRTEEWAGSLGLIDVNYYL